MFTPLMLSDDGKKHEPAAPGRMLDTAFIPVSAEPGNMLTRASDGLLATPGTLVSAVEPNALKVNVDGRLMVKAADLVKQGEKLLRARDGWLETVFRLDLDKSANRLRVLGVDDIEVSSVDMPAIPGLPTVVEILRDFTPPAAPGVQAPQEPGTYMHMRFEMSDGTQKDVYIDVRDFIDVYTGGNGIQVDGNVVSLKARANGGLAADDKGAYVAPGQIVDGADKVVMVRGGKIATELGISLDATGSAIVLFGRDGVEIGKATIPGLQGVPTVAEVLAGFTPPPAHGASGTLPESTYLHLHYDAVGDTAEADVYVDMADVMLKATDVTGALLFDKNNKLTVKAGRLISTDADNSIKAGSDGNLYVAPVKVKPQGGVKSENGELSADIPNLISMQAGNAVKLGSDGLLYVAVPEFQGGLNIDGQGKVTIAVDPDSPLRVDSQGRLTIDMTKIPTGVSKDSNNNLTEGSDGKPYYPADLGNV